MSYGKPVRLSHERVKQALGLLGEQEKRDGFVMLPRLARSDIPVYETVGEEPGVSGDVPVYFIFYKLHDGRVGMMGREHIRGNPYGYISSAIFEYLFRGVVDGPTDLLGELERRDGALYRKWMREQNVQKMPPRRSLQIQIMSVLSEAAKRDHIKRNSTSIGPLTYEMDGAQRSMVMDFWGDGDRERHEAA